MTTTIMTPPRWERATTFLEGLHRRIKNDNGAKATLKRSLSGEPRHIRNVYPLVLRYLEGVPGWEQEVWIFVACLSVYYLQDTREEQRTFGHSCQGLANATNSKGADRRFRSLLDTSLADIQPPLTALVRQMRSKAVRIDYPRLITDLRQWEHPDQYIQDLWARAFWGAPAPAQNDEQA